MKEGRFQLGYPQVLRDEEYTLHISDKLELSVVPLLCAGITTTPLRRLNVGDIK
jgi:D-arabinose 1-dehydrogenase-like Zn-dependent alcohol dehydrogenase